MTNVNVSLPDTLKEYIEDQVSSGGYGTTSEYLRELIRADRKLKAQNRLESAVDNVASLLKLSLVLQTRKSYDLLIFMVRKKQSTCK